MKVGLLRCQQTEDMCPGSTCFTVMDYKMFEFGDVEEDVKILGVNNCGGCPGKRAVPRAMEMIKRGVDTLVFASCISKGTPIGVACPHFENMKESIERKIKSSKVENEIKIIEYTHF